MNIPGNPHTTDDTLVPISLSGLRVATIDDQTVILDRSADRCHVLNSSSSIVWSYLDGGRTIRVIVDELAAESGMERHLVSPFVQDALDGFVDAGIMGFGPQSPESVRGDDEEPAPIPPEATDEGAAARLARSTRNQTWAPVRIRVLDRLPGMETHGPWQFGDVAATISTNRRGIGEYLERILEPMRIRNNALHGDTEHGTKPPIPIHIVGRPRGEDDLVSFYGEGHLGAQNISAAHAIETIFQRLNQMATSRTSDSILLHAGAVEFGGAVVVVAGESGRGKSTLTASLVQSGGAYVTDELVIIDPSDLHVRPYPKALDLGPHSLELLGLPLDDGFVIDKRHVPVSELGEVSPGGRVAALILLEPENSTEKLLGGVEAVTELLGHVFAATHAMPDSMNAIALLCCSVPVLRLPRSTPEATIARIEQAIGALDRSGRAGGEIAAK